MFSINKISHDLPALFFVVALFSMLAVSYGRQAAEWVLLKLYELLIGSKHHLTDIGQ